MKATPLVLIIWLVTTVLFGALSCQVVYAGDQTQPAANELTPRSPADEAVSAQTHSESSLSQSAILSTAPVPSTVSSTKESAPKIAFLRPMTNEVFSDAPFYIQVTVQGFKLIAPGESEQSQTAGCIMYTLDDFPVVCTKATQIMMNKNLGHGYIPTGKHYLRAELVDCNGHSLNPRIVADTQFWSVHPAYIEQTRAGVGASPTREEELRNVQRELQEVQQHLAKLESGDTGYEPKPMTRRTTKKRPTVPKTTATTDSTGEQK